MGLIYVLLFLAICWKISLVCRYIWRDRDDDFEVYVKEAQAVQDSESEIAEAEADVDIEEELPPTTRRRKGVYRHYLVMAGKAKFGSPSDTVANRLVVRKYLYDRCKDDGLLDRHIMDHLDIATALVFVPSENELVAAAIRHTVDSTRARDLLKSLTGDVPSVA